MKKKIGLIMSMVLLFVFVFSGINNTYVAHAEENNKFVIGTHNLNNTPQNSAKLGNKLIEPEIGWKRYGSTNMNIKYTPESGWAKNSDNSSYDKVYMGARNKSEWKMCFNFSGTKLRIIGRMAHDYDENAILILDNKQYSVNFKRIGSSGSTTCLVFDGNDLANTNHSVILSYNKNTTPYTLDAGIEAIDIDENGELKPYEEVAKAESISLDKTSMDLIEGSSDKINAKVLPEDATNKKVIWKSSDESIAKVDQEGKVTAIKEGQAAITAKVDGTDLTATCKVNVTKKMEENKNNAILSISLVNGATKEYDVSMQEVEKFINWFEERSNGKGPSLYSFNKKINPYKTVKEYIVHDKIASFEVREYEGTNK
ncbi:TPA: Ig domain-containing protein [Clostridium botulinum]|nr:Ig domain-containing protein [Clostridium botulinum]HCL4458518.1 Ig domain-containing protein [Clostridium botulinum]HCL4462430.1 Ig domain-containing protein [Clostridium botulinum]HCL4473489.1 Ig domain-containing protein [Clostridium botulinum]HCL4477079.1 Ig domain-containing protein [Clostridium botulinum]